MSGYTTLSQKHPPMLRYLVLPVNILMASWDPTLEIATILAVMVASSNSLHDLEQSYKRGIASQTFVHICSPYGCT